MNKSRLVALAFVPWAGLISWIYAVECEPSGLVYFPTIPASIASIAWLALALVLLAYSLVRYPAGSDLAMDIAATPTLDEQGERAA